MTICSFFAKQLFSTKIWFSPLNMRGFGCQVCCWINMTSKHTRTICYKLVLGYRSILLHPQSIHVQCTISSTISRYLPIILYPRSTLQKIMYQFISECFSEIFPLYLPKCKISAPKSRSKAKMILKSSPELLKLDFSGFSEMFT